MKAKSLFEETVTPEELISRCSGFLPVFDQSRMFSSAGRLLKVPGS